MDRPHHPGELSQQPSTLRSVAFPDGLYLVMDMSDPATAESIERQNQILILIVSLMIILAVCLTRFS